MPTLRNKSATNQSSTEQASTPDHDQNKKDPTGATASPAKSRANTSSSSPPDDRPSSPRRLRDRRLLAGFKPDTPSTNSQQSLSSTSKSSASPHKSDQSNASNSDQSHSPITSASTKRPHTHSPQDDGQEPPRSILKRSPVKSESLLVRTPSKQPASSNESKSTSALPSTSNHCDPSPTTTKTPITSKSSSLLVPPIRVDLRDACRMALMNESGRSHSSSSPIRNQLPTQQTVNPAPRRSHPASNSQTQNCLNNDGLGLNLVISKPDRRSTPSRNCQQQQQQHQHQQPGVSHSSPVFALNTSRPRPSGSSLNTVPHLPNNGTGNHPNRSRSSIGTSSTISPNRLQTYSNKTRRPPVNNGVANNSRLSSDTLQLTMNSSSHTTTNSDSLGPINMTWQTAKARSFNILIGVTGSVATIKLVELIQKLRVAFNRISNQQGRHLSIEIKVVMTENSKRFVPPELISRIFSQSIEVFEDADEWVNWNKVGDPVIHIELRKWADLLLIAPLDANTMAKLANGLCDNLLTCTVRAWDTSKPLIYCPAMNVNMYSHPITAEHSAKLDSYGYMKVDAIEKRLACGDFGLGAMASIESIVDKVIQVLLKPKANLVILPKQRQPDNASTVTISDPRRLSNGTSNSLLERLEIAGLRSILARSRDGTTNPTDTMRSKPRPSSADTNPLYRHHLPEGDGYYVTEGQDVIVKPQTYGRLVPEDNGSSIVTSLQNMKAVDLEAGDSSVQDEERDTSPDDDYSGSPMVASASVSDESTPNASNPQQKSSAGKSNGLSKNGETPAKGNTPRVDSAPLIPRCYNKSRNCYTCIFCKNDYKNRKSMTRHLKEQHLQGNIHRCSPCGMSYKRREKLIKHRRECHGLVD